MLARVTASHIYAFVGKTYCALSVGSLIVAVRRSAERCTGSGLATVTNASPLGEVLLTLLLANLNLLFLAAAAQLIGLECRLCLEVGAAVFRDVPALRHGGCVGACERSAVCGGVLLGDRCACPVVAGVCEPDGVWVCCRMWWCITGDLL